MTVVVQTTGELAALTPAWTPSYTFGSMQMYGQYFRTYQALYREQPNVRVCVEFLARNIAQLGLHVFRRVSDTDRVRLNDHPLAQVIKRPLPRQYKVTRYRLLESLMSDLGIFFNAYLLKIRAPGAPLGLLRIPPELVTPKGGLVITGYEVVIGAKLWIFTPDEIVHIRGHNPESSTTGLPPLETLRRILAEEFSSGEHREFMWQNAARMGGIIQRPANAPPWDKDIREAFVAEFEELYARGPNAGKTVVLEDGMEWKAITFNPAEMEYIAGRKLTREECARSYHIPLPLVGILDHATFSNIKEQHKHLYQDSLGPWLAMLEDDFDLQLVPEFGDNEGVYTEFNIAEKLQGDFGEQATSFQLAVGRPWMTPNEARARLNLPRDPDPESDQLSIPLNVTIGGQALVPARSGASPSGSRATARAQASPRDSAPKDRLRSASLSHEAKGIDSHRPGLRQRHEQKWVELLVKFYRRQEAAILSRLPKTATRNERKAMLGDIWWDEDRWNGELAADLLRLNTTTAETWFNEMADQLGADLDPSRMAAWLAEHSNIQAQGINSMTMAEMETALQQPDPQEAIKALFLLAATVWALRQATTGVTAAANFGAYDAAQAGGLKSKTWRVNNANPRPSHAAQDGMTVGIGENFPNGQRWPGDPAGGADEVAGCDCSVEFGKGE